MELAAAQEELRLLASMESSSELVVKQLAGFEKKISNMDVSATGACTRLPCSRRLPFGTAETARRAAASGSSRSPHSSPPLSTNGRRFTFRRA